MGNNLIYNCCFMVFVLYMIPLSCGTRDVNWYKKSSIFCKKSDVSKMKEEFKDIENLVVLPLNNASILKIKDQMRTTAPFLHVPVSEDPTMWPYYVGGALVGGAIAVVGTPILLGYAGFTVGGIVAGSTAATAQATLYGGAATGIFSTLQSVGAGGLSSAAAVVVGVAGGAVGAAAISAGIKTITFLISKDEKFPYQMSNQYITLFREEHKKVDLDLVEKFVEKQLKNHLKMKDCACALSFEIHKFSKIIDESHDKINTPALLIPLKVLPKLSSSS